jgi:transposase-like protein
VAAKEVQRQIGVTYKTAWRMCREIRRYMGFVDGDRPLGGDDGHDAKIVEVDDTVLGGYRPRSQMYDNKAYVLGIVERGGEVVLRVVGDHTNRTLYPHLARWIKPGSLVMTDEAKAFDMLDGMHDRQTVNHSEEEYVRGIVYTNTIESFWSHLKRSIKGTYISVSKKHLQKYLWEFEFRHNLRRSPHLMLDRLLQSFPAVLASPLPSASGRTAA